MSSEYLLPTMLGRWYLGNGTTIPKNRFNDSNSDGDLDHGLAEKNESTKREINYKSSSRIVKTMIDLPHWQFIGIIVSILGSAVGATAWITWRLSKVTTEVNNLKTREVDNLKDSIKREVDNLKDRVDKVDDDVTYMFRLDLEESHAAAGRVRSNSYGSSKKKAEKEDEKE